MMTTRYIEEVESIARGFEFETCEDCYGDLDQHSIAPDPLGHPHLFCLTGSSS